mmetsp:Transcript_42734/g.93256  ORF Transcript_42734/g.93256 Transcript_42734/m.93256 type:complete len:241 (+) Transcript_42734:938-1660(+)
MNSPAACMLPGFAQTTPFCTRARKTPPEPPDAWKTASVVPHFTFTIGAAGQARSSSIASELDCLATGWASGGASAAAAACCSLQLGRLASLSLCARWLGFMFIVLKIRLDTGANCPWNTGLGGGVEQPSDALVKASSVQASRFLRQSWPSSDSIHNAAPSMRPSSHAITFRQISWLVHHLFTNRSKSDADKLQADKNPSSISQWSPFQAATSPELRESTAAMGLGRTQGRHTAAIEKDKA